MFLASAILADIGLSMRLSKSIKVQIYSAHIVKIKNLWNVQKEIFINLLKVFKNLLNYLRQNIPSFLI